MENSKEIIINTNTVGMSFERFYSTIKSIRDTIALTNDIEDSDINIRIHDDSIPLINLVIGTDGNRYIVITKSAFMQCEPNGPLTFVLNSYQKLNEFVKAMNAIKVTTENDPIDRAECVVNTEGIITHITYFDLNIKKICKDYKNRSYTVYIRSEV